LGAAVVDEQHRFGVYQRVSLRDKAAEYDPDLLIMTATPIPRTLAMTLYGDLDVSLLDEMPPGRKPVRTRHVRPGSDDLDRMYGAV
ncbi:MAG: DNA helicase RecG, partial [Actinobacteria bacterium]|nr:DNA helicase RecG [Actinomycetota bacterium]NIS30063.1 DNA helicase RecG [Actinomycetota bacterium]NIV54970.1 DNA helicase RecG [Actinomycetota bacterium]NIV86324.1 DNA helicase RecG [Actinomycetota bacterium]NIW27126.1 DNA helicase RecG [Actinomycetota bacterium]